MNSTNPPRFIPHGITPTAEQLAIQLARHKVVLVDANAGAAKTTTLALRTGEALARGLAPEQILALAFTPEARDVMRQRLLELGVAPAVAARIAVLTFEDFAARRLALSDSEEVACLSHPRQLKPWVLAAVEQAGLRYAGQVEGLDLRTHNLALSQFLDTQLNLKASMALEADVEFMDHQEAADVLGVPVTDYLLTVEYERIRLAGGAGASFRGPLDASYDLACALAHGSEALQALPQYRLVLCDELHDLNEAAFRILGALLAQPHCYFVGAGDRDQVIHARQGASHEFLARRFEQAYPALVRLPLTWSYRYGPHLALAMAAFKRKRVESPLALHTEIRQLHYGDGEPRAGDAQDCAALVLDALQSWRKQGHALAGCAILIRERHQSVALENALLQAGIPYRTEQMAGYLRRDEILFLRGMIAIALGDLAAVRSAEVRRAIVDAMAIFGEVDLSPREMEMARNDIARDPQLLNDFFSAYIGHERRGGQPPHPARLAARQIIAATVAWLQSVDAAQPAGQVLAGICERMQLVTAARRIFVRPYDASVVARSVAGFVEAAHASRLDLRGFWAWLNASEDGGQRKRGRDAVLIECVASAKGKEYDHVLLPYLEAGEFPSALEDLRAEENLFYVGATRARFRLTLLSPAAAQRRSPFLAAMELPGSSASAAAAMTRNQSTAAPASHHRVYLQVAYQDKAEAKALGAAYDLARRAWYVPEGADPSPFRRWIR
ncbi:3'-5' exonuclease [Oxalobacteraceae bacterium A2-2]